VRKLAALFALLSVAMLFPTELSAKKNESMIRRPPRKPPVYKKFNNKKKKGAKFGTGAKR